MSDVDFGGNTVFPSLGVSVAPVKVTLYLCSFWWTPPRLRDLPPADTNWLTNRNKFVNRLDALIR